MEQDDYVECLDDVLDGVVELDDEDAVSSEAFSFFDRKRLLAVLVAASTNSAANPVAKERAIDFLRQQAE